MLRNARHGTRNWRLRRAAQWLALGVAAVAISWNAYHAGLRVGLIRGADLAAVSEAEAWRKIPKICTPLEIREQCPAFDPQESCEKWLYERWPPVSRDFKVDPRQSR
jgi:hypothetical protein